MLRYGCNPVEPPLHLLTLLTCRAHSLQLLGIQVKQRWTGAAPDLLAQQLLQNRSLAAAQG
jgi:hypothetical protein